ncbi:hypothetical protein CONPUDRAFT_164916 [Coniophora puteana RWD-64-598 SS2]|uniref:Uncharacterized protein n=1 Tax=Coniophora puteana (strain RWD-64-598) TaxID=741705 RepID=A0A5M3MU50_CONPW|nr:uncharacterized protein CONPUDRAFT_164916 [Coniophora puteana RWD-64-598 SS2]EIW82294.1 hypothetical protein CONPUDRAFT_164916 [Coniophora puteana RWD-64-598 SS2]
MSKPQTPWSEATPEIVVTEPSDSDCLSELPEAPSQDSVYSTASSNVDEADSDTSIVDVVPMQSSGSIALLLTAQSTDSDESDESSQHTLSSTEGKLMHDSLENDHSESDLQSAGEKHLQEASEDSLLSRDLGSSVSPEASVPADVIEEANLSLPRDSSASSLVIPESFGVNEETILSEQPPYPSDNEHEVSLDTDVSDDSVHFTISNESAKHLGLDVSQGRRESDERNEEPSETPAENALTAPIIPLQVPRVATYADATNLARRFPDLASRILESPLAVRLLHSDVPLVSNSPEPSAPVIINESTARRPRRRHWRGKKTGATSRQRQRPNAETEATSPVRAITSPSHAEVESSLRSDLTESISEAAPDWANAPPEPTSGRASLQTNRDHSGRGRRPRGGKKPRKLKQSYKGSNHEASSVMNTSTIASPESCDSVRPQRNGYDTGDTIDDSTAVPPQQNTATTYQGRGYAAKPSRRGLNFEAAKPLLYSNETTYNTGSRLLDRISPIQIAHPALALTKDAQRRNVRAMMDDASATIDLSSMAKVTWPSTGYYARGGGIRDGSPIVSGGYLNLSPEGGDLTAAASDEYCYLAASGLVTAMNNPRVS